MNWLERCYDEAGAGSFGISRAQFEACLHEVAAKYCEPEADRTRFFQNLHLYELALARACALGNEKAWEECVARYSQSVFRAALHITRQELQARELSQSLWTDLFCSAASGKASKFLSYSGRGSLESWLKAILFQSAINLYRAERRFLSLEESLAPVCRNLAPGRIAEAEANALITQMLKSALGQLTQDERFLLAAYFLDGRNLTQIGALLRVHESTVSRRIEKTRKSLQKTIRRQLRARGIEPSAFPMESFTTNALDLRNELLPAYASSEDPL